MVQHGANNAVQSASLCSLLTAISLVIFIFCQKYAMVAWAHYWQARHFRPDGLISVS